MKEDFYIGKYKWLVPTVITILTLSILMSRCSDNNLEQYKPDSSSAAETTTVQNNEPEKPEDVELAEYYSETYSFRIEYPREWTKAENGSKISFVDKASKTTMTVAFLDYDPAVNMMNEDMAVSNINSSDMRNFLFSRSNDNYSISYYSNGYYICEKVLWDYQNIVSVSIAAPEEYGRISDFEYYLSTVEWDSSDPIPENLYIKYYDYGNFQLGFPGDWSYGVSDNSILSSNANDTATISIIVNEASGDLSGVSQVDYINDLAANRENFIPETYTNNGTAINCTGTYTFDGKQAVVRQFVLTNGRYCYVLTIDNISNEENISETVMAVINSFKVFS